MLKSKYHFVYGIKHYSVKIILIEFLWFEFPILNVSMSKTQQWQTDNLIRQRSDKYISGFIAFSWTPQRFEFLILNFDFRNNF